MDPGVLISLVIGGLGIIISIVIWAASTRAMRTTKAQESPGSYLRALDQDAIARARETYEGTIAAVERDNARKDQAIAAKDLEILRLNRELAKAYRRIDDSGPQKKIE